MPMMNLQVWPIILFYRNESAILAQIHTNAAQVVCDGHRLRRYMIEIRRLYGLIRSNTGRILLKSKSVLYGRIYTVLLLSKGDHSDLRTRRLKWPEMAIKRRITALNLTVFRRNPSTRFTDRFFARRRRSFLPIIFVVIRADVKQWWNTPISAVLHCLRPFTVPFSRAWICRIKCKIIRTF
jgi:hypothetical protein